LTRSFGAPTFPQPLEELAQPSAGLPATSAGFLLSKTFIKLNRMGSVFHLSSKFPFLFQEIFDIVETIQQFFAICPSLASPCLRLGVFTHGQILLHKKSIAFAGFLWVQWPCSGLCLCHAPFHDGHSSIFIHCK